MVRRRISEVRMFTRYQQEIQTHLQSEAPVRKVTVLNEQSHPVHSSDAAENRPLTLDERFKALNAQKSTVNNFNQDFKRSDAQSWHNPTSGPSEILRRSEAQRRQVQGRAKVLIAKRTGKVAKPNKEEKKASSEQGNIFSRIKYIPTEEEKRRALARRMSFGVPQVVSQKNSVFQRLQKVAGNGGMFSGAFGLGFKGTRPSKTKKPQGKKVKNVY